MMIHLLNYRTNGKNKLIIKRKIQADAINGNFFSNSHNNACATTSICILGIVNNSKWTKVKIVSSQK